MKIAAFNVENLFDRPKVFNEGDPALTQATIRAVAELNSIFQEDEYGDEQKVRILELVEQLELDEREEGPLAFIRRIRGTLLRRPRDGDPEVVAGGKEDWVGWAELKIAPVHVIAVLNTGRVMRDVDAHILAVIEAEDRVSLKTLDQFVLDRVNDEPPPTPNRNGASRPPKALSSVPTRLMALPMCQTSTVESSDGRFSACSIMRSMASSPRSSRYSDFQY